MSEIIGQWAWNEAYGQLFQIAEIRPEVRGGTIVTLFRGNNTFWMSKATYIGPKTECEQFQEMYLQRKEEKRMTTIINTKEYIV